MAAKESDAIYLQLQRDISLPTNRSTASGEIAYEVFHRLGLVRAFDLSDNPYFTGVETMRGTAAAFFKMYDEQRSDTKIRVLEYRQHKKSRDTRQKSNHPLALSTCLINSDSTCTTVLDRKRTAAAPAKICKPARHHAIINNLKLRVIRKAIDAQDSNLVAFVNEACYNHVLTARRRCRDLHQDRAALNNQPHNST